MPEPVVGALIRSQDKANKCMKVIILHKTKGILRFWKRKIINSKLLKIEAILLMVQKSQGQPPGMYTTLWIMVDILPFPQLVNAGFLPSTVWDSSQEGVISCFVQELKSTCYQWVPELSWVFGSTYTKRWQAIKNSTEWAGVSGTFWEFFKKVLCSFCMFLVFCFWATSFKLFMTWKWYHRQFGLACAFHSPSLIRHPIWQWRMLMWSWLPWAREVLTWAPWYLQMPCPRQRARC